MPTWPFSSGTSPDTINPPTRVLPFVDRHTQAPLVQSPIRLDPFSSFNVDDVNETPVRPGLPSPKRSHVRSLSGTLPSLFGGTKKKSLSNDESFSKPNPTARDGVNGLILSKRTDPKSKAEEGDLDTGICATCGTKVKWPKGIPQFRCNICLMVNDLVITQRKSEHPKRPTLSERNGNEKIKEVTSNDLSLSVARITTIIDSCVMIYLRSRKPGAKASSQPPAITPSRSPLRNSRRLSVTTVQREDVVPSSHQSPFREESPFPGNISPTNRQRYGYMRPPGPTISGDSRFVDTDGRQSNLSTNSASVPVDEDHEASHDIGHFTKPTRGPPPPPAAISSHSYSNEAKHTPLQSPYSSDEAIADNEIWSRPAEKRVVTTDLTADPRTIFQALEDDLLRTFGNYHVLNTSFLASPPVPRGPVQNDDQNERVRSRSDVGKMRHPDGSLSELDAKTLLLGDVAENGFWWTGRDTRTNSPSTTNKLDRMINSFDNLVALKSPSINFFEVSRWYATVIGAGENWRRSLSSKEEPLAIVTDLEAQEIDATLLTARSHIRRTLLKISEVVLKRPGHPLKNPNDIRFLLILLANPLLESTRTELMTSDNTMNSISSMTSLPTEQTLKASRKARPDLSGKRRHQQQAGNQQNQSFVVLKRILGLLSNLSNEIHRYLTSWFTRYTESQFRRLVDLIQSFITYRLRRQQPRKSGNGTMESNLIPGLAGTSAATSAQLHAAFGLPSQTRVEMESAKYPSYSLDWQIKSAARVMALLFSANRGSQSDASPEHSTPIKSQLLATPDFYNTMVDLSDLIKDFDTWESGQGRFAFCQYPFFLSVGAKIRIMEHDARRQMEIKAREAFFNSILRNKNLEQYLILKVRRDCLVEDSLKGISEVVGAGQQDIKKGLKVQFIDEEGIDAGGLRKEWFLLLAREIFEPQHGLFVYDEDSHHCYFNPHSFETSDQYFLVGALLGLAIYNSTILDIALPPFTFKKLLASGSVSNSQKTPFNRMPLKYTLEDLAEYRPALAKGLRQVLDYEGDVESNLCLDFAAEVDRYGSKTQVPLCTDGEKKPVTNANRQEFVDLYVRYLLDTQVSRQFEPFKRGFFTVCGGNALSLFQPEEIELLVRGSDEPLDVQSFKAVAIYDNWRRGERKVENPAEEIALIQWFWELFEQAEPKDQRKLLGFITGSDRIPAMGAASLVIKIAFAGRDHMRFPIARTCFNLLLLYKYRTKAELEEKLWRAVTESEGFGLK